MSDSTVSISPSPVLAYWDNNGDPLVAGQLFTYLAGTVTKAVTYTDSTGATPQTNPVVLNARGEIATVSGDSAGLWLQTGVAYKFVLAPATDTDPPTDPFWTVDNIVAEGGGDSGLIKLSFPQDGELIVYSEALGAITNALNGGKTRTAKTASATNVVVANPPTSISNYDMQPGDIVFLFGQANPVENGLWQYTTDENPMVRPSNYATGKQLFSKNTTVTVTDGDFGGDIYQLVSPDIAFVDTDPTTWGLFGGFVQTEPVNTFNAGPTNGSQALPTVWRTLVPLDSPPRWNGDNAWESAGRPIYDDIDRLGDVGGYWDERNPWANHEMIIQRAQRSLRIWLATPEIYIETPDPGSVLSNRCMYAEAPGQGRPASFVMPSSISALTLANCTNLKVYGNLHIRYQAQATSNTKAISITGISSDIYFERLTIENGWHGVYINGAVDNVIIDHLVLKNCIGTGIYCQGTATGARVTNILVKKITWINTTQTGNLIVASTYDWTGAPGIPGLTILGGSGSGELTTYLQSASTGANAPQGCDVRMVSSGATSVAWSIVYGQGVNRIVPGAYAGGANGLTIASTLSGVLTVDNAEIVGCHSHGVEIASTSRVMFNNPTINNNSTAGAASFDGFHADANATRFSVDGGIINGTNHNYNINTISGNTTFWFYGTDLSVFATAAVNLHGQTPGTFAIDNCYGYTASPWP